MPDDRLFHSCLGQSDKVNNLSDFEELVWRDYINAADDFGIMRFSAVTLQAKFDRMARRPVKVIEKALANVKAADLVRTFVHQSRTYCYQWDWQDWQHVTYPRRTAQPLPIGAQLGGCSMSTRWLFTLHPDGGKLEGGWKAPKSFQPAEAGETPDELPKDSGETPEKLPVNSSPARTALAVSRLPLAVGRGEGALAGTLPRDHMRHSWCSQRGKCVPEFLHNEFCQAVDAEDLGRASERLRAFYAAVEHGWPPGPIGDDPVKL